METVILHYCYKVNQEDFNGRAMLLLSTLFFFYFTIMHVFSKLIMQYNNEFSNYKDIIISIICRNPSFVRCILRCFQIKDGNKKYTSTVTVGCLFYGGLLFFNL